MNLGYYVKFLLCAVIFCVINGCSAEIFDLNSMSESLDLMMTGDEEVVRWPRQFEAKTWIWEDYEFGSGVGNREELSITSIEVWNDFGLHENVTNWNILESNENIYIVGTVNSTVLLYTLDTQTNRVSFHASVSVPETIKSFKLIHLLHSIDEPIKNYGVYLIVSVEGSNKESSLRWFYLLDYNFIHLQSYTLMKPVESFEYFNFNYEPKLLLLYEKEIIFNETFSQVEIYDMRINYHTLYFGSCNQFLAPEIVSVHACPPREDRTTISLLSKDQVLLYEYKDEDIMKCVFKKLPNILIKDVLNTICFESGNIHYLAISGSASNLYKFHDNKYLDDESIRNLFNEIGNIKFIQSLPVDTYRDEVILLVQLKNTTVLTFSWQGSGFKLIPLPNQNLNNFNLSSVKIIPNFGFLSGNTFVKFKVDLNQLSRPEENEIGKMFEMKTTLENILFKQEWIINETELVLDESYLKNSEIKGFFNLTEAEIDEFAVDNANNFTVILKSINSTLHELQINYENAMESANKLEAKMDKIEHNAKSAVLKNVSDISLHEIEIQGHLEVKGTLSVENLTANYLNDISMDVLTKECSENDQKKIVGIKSFPSIDYNDSILKIKNINGIPLNNILFDEPNKNHTEIDLSKITKLVIAKDLIFSEISDANWKDFVFRNEDKFIPGLTTILGLMSTRYVRIDYLNDLKYPHDYVVKSGPEDAYMTSNKFFNSLTVSTLQEVKTINDIDADEFITLNEDQTLKHQITFEHLQIIESLQISDNVKGFPQQNIDPDLTLLNSNIVQSNAMFTNLYISGKIYVENLINGTTWSKLDDLILNDEDNVTVTGTKTFLGNVEFANDLEIQTGLINGHPQNKFITLDTRQILTNLSTISGNVKFTEVTYEELLRLEESIHSHVDDANVPICMKKPIIFSEPPIIDEITFSYINENLTGTDYSKKLEAVLKNVSFEELNAKSLVVENLQPTTLNGMNVQSIKDTMISKTGNQSISGNVTIDYLESKQLNTNFVNRRSVHDLENTVDKINTFYDSIFNGSIKVDSLNVTGTIVTPKINEESLSNFLGLSDKEEFIFRNNQSIENVIVEGLINGLNFNKKVHDTVLKTEERVTIKGPKKIKKLKSQNLEVLFLNGHSVSDLISADKTQTLTGPVKMRGSVNVQKSFNSTGKINQVHFKDISEVISKLDDKMYKLTGDFEVDDDAFIPELNVFGYILQRDIDEFMENLIYLNSEEVLVTGAKVFNDTIHFGSEIYITENLNGIDLKTFYQNAVLTDRPISISSPLVFDNDVMLENDLHVGNNLKVGTIKDINIEDLMANAVYINRPTSIADAVTLANVKFMSDITVESWNSVSMHTLMTLDKDEIIQNILLSEDVSVNELEINGFVNGEHLPEFYANTFTVSTDQIITGTISFLNNVHVKNDFNSQYINYVDMFKTISLNDTDPLIGNYVFENPITVNNSLKILGKIIGVNLTNWQSTAVKTASPSSQIISGNWIVHGDVDFQQKMVGSGTLNGVNIRKLAEDIEKRKEEAQNSLSNKMQHFKELCEDLQYLKYEAENIFYKFKAFEYLRVLEFDQKAISFHHFELDNLDYIMVNFETCHLDVFAYANKGFVFATNKTNFGYVKQYITLNYNGNVYFVTIGKPGCGRSSGNFWSIENYQLEHVLDLGNATDVKKLGSDGFVIIVDHTVQEWSVKQISEKALKPLIIPIKDKNVQFFSNENDTLLASHDTIFALRSDDTISESPSEFLEFEEYENPFSTKDIVTFRAGVYQKEYILYYDDRISSGYIFICNNNLSQRKVLQTIEAQNPSSFLILNFDQFQESFLIFSENKRKIQIYEYKGVEGFKYHSSIKMKNDRLFKFELQMYPYFVKRHCLAIIEDNKLTILQAKMYGERLKMNNHLTCGKI